jgi:hypothetical protein
MNYETLIMRRFMRQIAKKATSLKSRLNLTTSIIKLSQKGMIYDTLFSLFLLFHKGAFMRRYFSLQEHLSK